MNFSKLTVLVADDELGIRMSIKYSLKDMGFKEIIVVEDGSKAWGILQKKAVDLVISDSNMLEMIGEVLLLYMRENDDLKDIPFIFLTGTKEKTFKTLGIDGYDGYVPKPFQIDKLKSEIERVLEKKAKAGEGQVDKEVCLWIVDRMIKVVHYPILTPPIEEAIFAGKVQDYKLYNNTDFQKFLKENNVKPEEEIVIWEDKPDVFRVVKKSEMI